VSTRSKSVPNYTLQTCPRCRAEYDPFYAEWCSCDRLSRSLICPDCLTCFCEAPADYRQKYWSTSPAAIRHDAQRFGFQPARIPALDTCANFEHHDFEPRVA